MWRMPQIPVMWLSGDGTHHRWGFQTRNGVVTAVSVILRSLTQVLSNYCDACRKKEKKLGPGPAFEAWMADHQGKGFKCNQNHTGSAAAIEPQGTLTILCFSALNNAMGYSMWTFLEMETVKHMLLWRTQPSILTSKFPNLNAVVMYRSGWEDRWQINYRNVKTRHSPP